MSGEYTLARPYAKALFELANSNNALGHWSETLLVAKQIAEHPRVHAMLKNPTISQDKVLAFFKSVAGDIFDSQIDRLLSLMSDNKRLLLISTVYELFEQMRKEAQKIVDVEMVAAQPIPPALEKKITQALERRLQKTVSLSCRTDPSLIGGAILRAGDWVIDGSVKGRLSKIYDAMGIS